MKLIDADHERLYSLPGVAEPARRPVDIDAAQTAFTRLRSLRVYRFAADVPVEGHAEEDEVFVVVTGGCVQLKIKWEDGRRGEPAVYTLKAPTAKSTDAFVAYLPPHSAYELTPSETADIAYARATPSGTSRVPGVYGPLHSEESSGATTLLELMNSAEHLRLKVIRVRRMDKAADIDVRPGGEAGCEVLVHFQGVPEECVSELVAQDAEPVRVRSWQTAVMSAGERAMFRLAEGADVMVMAVAAV